MSEIHPKKRSLKKKKNPHQPLITNRKVTLHYSIDLTMLASANGCGGFYLFCFI